LILSPETGRSGRALTPQLESYRTAPFSSVSSSVIPPATRKYSEGACWLEDARSPSSVKQYCSLDRSYLYHIKVYIELNKSVFNLLLSIIDTQIKLKP
jgi:hypothetical protein